VGARSATGGTAAAAVLAAALVGCGVDVAGTIGAVTVDDVFEKAQMLDGRTVEMAVVVDEALAGTAATVVSRGPAADTGGETGAEEQEPTPPVGDLLVVHDPDEELREGAAVVVVGAVDQGFDLREVEEELGVDYDDRAFARFAGEPYVIARSVEEPPG
jgi:hypothetical protein